jgi:hypothetical protein
MWVGYTRPRQGLERQYKLREQGWHRSRHETYDHGVMGGRLQAPESKPGARPHCLGLSFDRKPSTRGPRPRVTAL